jgi:hypothetical protein
LISSAAGKKYSHAIDLFWQFGKDRAQTLGRGEPKIRGLQFPLLQNPKFPTSITSPGYSFDKRPSGFRAATFHSEDALTGFHDCVWIAVVWGN